MQGSKKGRAGAERSAPAPSTREPGWRARVSSVAEDADPAVLRSHGAAAEAGPGRLAEARTRPAQADPDDAASESGSDSGSDSDSDAGCLPGLAQSMWAALASGRVAPAAARAPAEAAARKPGRRRAVHGDRAAAAAEPGRALPSGAAAAAEAAAAGLAGSGRRAAAEGAGEGQDTVAEIAWVPHTGLPAPSGGSGPAQDAGSELGLAKQALEPLRGARRLARAQRKAAPKTAGRGWFDLPATQITDEVKRDLRLLHLRAALDPKRFYKGFDQSKFPKYFQLGTVVEGAADFYAGRLPRKQRKRTLTDELLADAELTHVRKKRYGALQEERQRFRRVKRRKTDLPRLKKAHRRPKH